MRLAAQAKGGFYPTPPLVTNIINSHLYFGRAYSGAGIVRMLDPCCGEGIALAEIKHNLAQRSPSIKFITYGIELQQERARTATEHLDHVLGADLFSTAIGNNNFGLLLLNPPYDHDHEHKRLEHRFLTYSTRYLVENGILIYIIPRHRLAVSAEYLAANYTGVRCYAFPEKERQAFNQVVLFGKKRIKPMPSPYKTREIETWAHQEFMQPIAYEQYANYSPELTPHGEILFSTRRIDPHAAAQEARISGLWKSTEVTNALWPPIINRRRPLMPLRKGHLAMLIAAGFLDNIAIESEGKRLLVKGLTTKEFIQVEQTENKDVHRERLTTTVVALDLETGEFSDIAT